MTPRKFYRMYDEYLIMNGLKKEIDSAIDALPEECSCKVNTPFVMLKRS